MYWIEWCENGCECIGFMNRRICLFGKVLIIRCIVLGGLFVVIGVVIGVFVVWVVNRL